MILETRGVNKEDGISDQRGPAGHGWSFLGIKLFGMLGLTDIVVGEDEEDEARSRPPVWLESEITSQFHPRAEA